MEKLIRFDIAFLPLLSQFSAPIDVSSLQLSISYLCSLTFSRLLLSALSLAASGRHPHDVIVFRLMFVSPSHPPYICDFHETHRFLTQTLSSHISNMWSPSSVIISAAARLFLLLRLVSQSQWPAASVTSWSWSSNYLNMLLIFFIFLLFSSSTIC